MLTPEYMNNLPDELIAQYEKLEETIIKDISRRINKAATLTPTSAEQIKVLTNLGYEENFRIFIDGSNHRFFYHIL